MTESHKCPACTLTTFVGYLFTQSSRIIDTLHKKNGANNFLKVNKI